MIILPAKRDSLMTQKKVKKPLQGDTKDTKLKNKIILSKSFLELFNNVQEAMIIHDLHGKILAVNKQFLSMFKTDEERAFALSIKDDLSSYTNSLDLLDGIWADVILGKPKTFEWTAKRPEDGFTFPVEVFLTKLSFSKRDVILASIKDITHYKSIQKEVEEKAMEVENFFNLSPDLFCITDKNGVFVKNNIQWKVVLGYEPKDLKNMHLWDFAYEKDVPVIKEKINEAVASDKVITFETGYRCKDQSLKCLEFRCTRNNSNIFTVALDITERKESERIILDSKQRLEMVLYGSEMAIWDWDIPSGRIIVNERWHRLVGTQEHQQAKSTITEWEKSIHFDDIKNFNERLNSHVQGQSDFFECEYRVLNRSGKWTWIQSKGKIVERDHSEKPLRMCGTHINITKRKELEEKMFKMAHYDKLTGLPNRELFFERFSQSIIQHRRDKKSFALFFIDLDNFKYYNDSYGHEAGDRILVITAQRLLSSVRKSDIVARMGGDEFTIILRNISSIEGASNVAAKIIDIFSKPFYIGDIESTIGISLGISVFPKDGDNSEELIRKADTAMYSVKKTGKRGYRFYEENK